MNMIKKLNQYLIISLAVLLLTACDEKTEVSVTNTVPPIPKTIVAEFDQPFTVHVGQTAILDPLQLTVTEIRDIRCPSQVLCAEKGFAQITISITEDDQPTQTYLMNSDPVYKPEFGLGTSSITHNSYTVTLTNVEPYPELPEDVIPLETYQITFVVSKGN